MLRKFCLVVGLVVFCAARTSSASDEAPSRLTANSSQTIELAGHVYRYPHRGDTFPRYFGKPVATAVELRVPKSFWIGIWSKVAPVRGWMAGGKDDTSLLYITLPDELFQWKEHLENHRAPPVRGPLQLVAERNTMRTWRSFDPETSAGRNLYINFEGRKDFYVMCAEQAVGDWTRSCEIYWNDKGVLHLLGIAGDWIEHAPAVVSEYARALDVR